MFRECDRRWRSSRSWSLSSRLADDEYDDDDDDDDDDGGGGCCGIRRLGCGLGGGVATIGEEAVVVVVVVFVVVVAVVVVVVAVEPSPGAPPVPLLARRSLCPRCRCSPGFCINIYYIIEMEATKAGSMMRGKVSVGHAIDRWLHFPEGFGPLA